MASLSRFLVVAKSYGGQFRSIWEHCLLYSNGSTDGDVNKSIEICPTHMVGADHSDVLKNSYLNQIIGFKLRFLLSSHQPIDKNDRLPQQGHSESPRCLGTWERSVI